MLNEIVKRFEANLGRSRNLIDIYDRAISQRGSVRPAAPNGASEGELGIKVLCGPKPN